MSLLIFTLAALGLPFGAIIPPLLWFTPREKREDAIGYGFSASLIAMVAMLLLSFTLFVFAPVILVPLVGWLAHQAAKKAGAGDACFWAMLSSVGILVVGLCFLIAAFTNFL